MTKTMRLLLSVAVLIQYATAHFLLQYPLSLGFNDMDEVIAPCGGFDIPASGVSNDLPVDGFPLQLYTMHPQSDFAIRFTTRRQEPFNWTNLQPVLSQQGLGAFCLPQVSAPSEWEGQDGVLQVIQHGPDGFLYQCATVNFVPGTNNTASGCSNATAVTASFTGSSDIFGGSEGGDTSDSGSSTSGESSTSESGTASASGEEASSMPSSPSSLANGLVSGRSWLLGVAGCFVSVGLMMV